jgi:hypothetical protein
LGFLIFINVFLGYWPPPPPPPKKKHIDKKM